MIDRFRVRGYKSLADVTLFPAPVNLIVGPSCCGKTNLLEALALLGAAVSGDMRRGPYRRGMRTEGPHASALRCLSGEPIRIDAASERIVYRVHLDEGRALRYRSEVVEVDGRAIASRGPDACWATYGGHPIDLYAPPGEGVIPMLCFLDDGARMARFRNTAGPISIADRQLPDVIEAEAIAIAIDEVSKLVPSVGSGFTLDAYAFFRRLVLRDRTLRDGRINPDNMGNGALWLLAVFLLLMSMEAPPVFAIDGADIALPPDIAAAAGRRICDLAINGNRQLFWAASEAHALAMFGHDSRARVFHLSRDWRGATVVEEGASHVP